MTHVRRVVTVQAQGGKARIASDGRVPTVFGSASGPILIEVWKTTATPSILTDADEEPAAGPLSLEPPIGGSLFRIVEIPPDAEMAAAEDHPIFDQLGEGEHGGDHSAQMHRTDTIDYCIVLRGKITLVADDDEAELETGDVVIQRGANHAWSNRGTEPCRMAFVQISARYA